MSDCCWPTLTARYVLVADVGLSAVCPMVISQKLSKTDQQLLWNITKKLAPMSASSPDAPPQAGRLPLFRKARSMCHPRLRDNVLFGLARQASQLFIAVATFLTDTDTIVFHRLKWSRVASRLTCLRHKRIEHNGLFCSLLTHIISFIASLKPKKTHFVMLPYGPSIISQRW